MVEYEELLCWGAYEPVAANEFTTKMTEQTQSQQVTMKDLNKVEVGKKLAEYNRRKRKELAKVQKIESKPKLTSSQYYGVGAIVAIRALGILDYYAYGSKK